ncbi:MAG TPA: adenylate kinase [Bryobacteraceae bacterium]|nr:adenylate kinase [Bryobacteraceae bacterium]
MIVLGETGTIPLVILLFGPPGSGKGTQARLIAEHLHIPAISTGDMLRSEAQAGSELGRIAQKIMSNGGLVSDDLINRMLECRIMRVDCRHGFLLDGYPRTVQQAEFLDGLLAEKRLGPPIVIHLDVPCAALVARLTSRRTCPKCGRIYNLLHQPPRMAGICDVDGAELVTRKDDTEETARERLKTYDELTWPVIAHYRDANYHLISGDRSPQYIFEAIQQVLEPYMRAQAAN